MLCRSHRVDLALSWGDREVGLRGGRAAMTTAPAPPSPTAPTGTPGGGAGPRPLPRPRPASAAAALTSAAAGDPRHRHRRHRAVGGAAHLADGVGGGRYGRLTYRLDVDIRSATALGIVGAGGIGDEPLDAARVQGFGTVNFSR